MDCSIYRAKRWPKKYYWYYCNEPTASNEIQLQKQWKKYCTFHLRSLSHTLSFYSLYRLYINICIYLYKYGWYIYKFTDVVSLALQRSLQSPNAKMRLYKYIHTANIRILYIYMYVYLWYIYFSMYYWIIRLIIWWIVIGRKIFFFSCLSLSRSLSFHIQSFRVVHIHNLSRCAFDISLFVVGGACI